MRVRKVEKVAKSGRNVDTFKDLAKDIDSKLKSGGIGSWLFYTDRELLCSIDLSSFKDKLVDVLFGKSKSDDKTCFVCSVYYATMSDGFIVAYPKHKGRIKPEEDDFLLTQKMDHNKTVDTVLDLFDNMFEYLKKKEQSVTTKDSKK